MTDKSTSKKTGSGNSDSGTAEPYSVAKKGAPKKFLFQLRSRDNEFGISEETFVRLMEELALNQTELVHKALRNLAKEVLPAYAPDDGPLTEKQHAAIRKLSGLDISENDLDSPLFK
ncbi:hypothetical protein NLZ15_03945 [Atlantibacter subterranea]|uniref:hypothetical protein n=1 Tax=Atlantibacter subterraneus TaxID=255519 RepID=UPI0020C28CB4|nr:hypothetical protein [Atlantibacter subterranea]UTJ48229.1 hypothetical protein NLZ15_03945 [Atlantibacter subterranea]